jgi:hypothetical protein
VAAGSLRAAVFGVVAVALSDVTVGEAGAASPAGSGGVLSAASLLIFAARPGEAPVRAHGFDSVGGWWFLRFGRNLVLAAREGGE